MVDGGGSWWWWWWWASWMICSFIRECMWLSVRSKFGFKDRTKCIAYHNNPLQTFRRASLVDLIRTQLLQKTPIRGNVDDRKCTIKCATQPAILFCQTTQNGRWILKLILVSKCTSNTVSRFSFLLFFMTPVLCLAWFSSPLRSSTISLLSNVSRIKSTCWKTTHTDQ